ncbi:Leucine-rich repeat protein kinase family protein, putative isoform 1 [Hibiscus syriacus]|uniref:Leucine-rich repeat protein kinase family protein, putative isoform 1 n=1 Tax=Hibiscus syriacus TaxID=106335 RepID=A0A6A2ZD09_HIBSY|nr:Leucine-rich repeat protein kinase family protein, putative isoform 1 [Hibiscus syriacus]
MTTTDVVTESTADGRTSPPARFTTLLQRTPLSEEKHIPQPGTYVIQIPKDQAYRVPPPENARRYSHLSKSKSSRSTSCRFCCCLLTTILSLLLGAAIAAAVIYFVFKPEAPNNSIANEAIKGFNLASSSPLSPEFDLTARENNPNDKIGIYFEKGSSVKVD